MFENLPERSNEVMYRKIKGFGWHIVGYSAAKQQGLTHYAAPAIQCAKGHVAPMSVEKTKCIKCLAVEARNRGTVMTDAESFEYWRVKLKLPKVESTSNTRHVYVVENMPYTKLQEACDMTGIATSIIYYRCQNEQFPDYQKLPTQYNCHQRYVYVCGENSYNTMVDACEGEGLNSQVIMIRLHDPRWTDWIKQKVL